MRLETNDFVFTIFCTRFCLAVLVRVYPNTAGGYPPPARKVVQLLRGVNPPEPKSNEKQVLLLRWGGLTPLALMLAPLHTFVLPSEVAPVHGDDCQLYLVFVSIACVCRFYLSLSVRYM